MAEKERPSNPLLLPPEKRMEAEVASSPPTDAADAERPDRGKEVLPLATDAE
jgi:hypothetical protein